MDSQRPQLLEASDWRQLKCVRFEAHFLRDPAVMSGRARRVSLLDPFDLSDTHGIGARSETLRGSRSIRYGSGERSDAQMNDEAQHELQPRSQTGRKIDQEVRITMFVPSLRRDSHSAKRKAFCLELCVSWCETGGRWQIDSLIDESECQKHLTHERIANISILSFLTIITRKQRRSLFLTIIVFLTVIFGKPSSASPTWLLRSLVSFIVL